MQEVTEKECFDEVPKVNKLMSKPDCGS